MKYLTDILEPFGALVTPKLYEQKLRVSEIKDLKCLLDKHQLLVLRGFQPFKSVDDFTTYCEGWGQIGLWPFGKVLELIEHESPEDHIFDHNYVPMHWDGMYRPQVPELQVFNCVKAPEPEEGGETTFCNTSLAIKNSGMEELKLWSKAHARYERKMAFYHSRTEAPIICKHPYRDTQVLRYCEPPTKLDVDFVNHPEIHFGGVSDKEAIDLQQSLKEALYHDGNFYTHKWQCGDVVISDNYTLLHGRKAYKKGSQRHLRRVHVLGRPPLNNPHLVFHK